MSAAAVAPEFKSVLPTGGLYWLKLVFADRRWAVEEKELAAPPVEGDLVELGKNGRWQVYDRQSVHVRPSGKPDREFLVCRPVP